jgi:type VI secretion system secreted protein Hcp
MLKRTNKLFPVVFLGILLGLVIASTLNFGLSSNSSADTLENTNATSTSQTVYMYLTMKAQKQGTISGSVTTKGHEGSIMVLSYTHSIVSPRDPASGLPTGKRQHKPLVITKELDKSTPLLYNALTTNDIITIWEMTFYRPSPTGALQLFFTIQLTNANIAGIDVRGSGFGVTEFVSFTYQKITWIWADGGIESTDDWEAPVV